MLAEKFLITGLTQWWNGGCRKTSASCPCCRERSFVASLTILFLVRVLMPIACTLAQRAQPEPVFRSRTQKRSHGETGHFICAAGRGQAFGHVRRELPSLEVALSQQIVAIHHSGRTTSPNSRLWQAFFICPTTTRRITSAS